MAVFGGDKPRTFVTGTIAHVSKTGSECRLTGSDRRYRGPRGVLPFVGAQAGNVVTLGLNSMKNVVDVRMNPSTITADQKKWLVSERGIHCQECITSPLVRMAHGQPL